MSTNTFAFASIRALGRLLRSGETTPTELANYYIDRLDRVGRRLNAVLSITRDRAFREARLAEAELSAGYDRGPLHGIPFGAKDLLSAAGYPTTWGAAPLRDQAFAKDATSLRRLRDAGAVLIAKLAMVELAGGMGYVQPNASLTGPGVTPWNLEAWSGGSSSGSGSAVASGCVPFALGSETWGSIITPASYCGISGLRPTYGRVSRNGAMALCWTLDKIGPMARSADDCGLVLNAIAGADPDDPTTLETTYRYDPGRHRARGFRIGVVRDGLEQMQPAVRENFERAISLLEKVGMIEDARLPDYPYQETINVILRVEAAAAMEELMDRGQIAGLTAPEDRIGGFAGAYVPAVDYLRAMRSRHKISVALDDLFSGFDAIVAPSTGLVASPLSVNFDDYGGENRRLDVGAAGNLTGLPAISVPNGFGDRGLPTGIQLVGRVGSENSILALACSYQNLTDWHLRTPSL